MRNGRSLMKKALKSIADSWFGYLVGSVFLTGIGDLIGGLLTGAFGGIYAGLAHGDEIVGMTNDGKKRQPHGIGRMEARSIDS